jgi:GC-rich sequence DNA-binding factor
MTSTHPLAFKRTKAKPAQRTRQPSSDIDAEISSTAAVDESPSTLATKLKNKVKKRPKARLSFGGDEDEVCVCISH